MDSTSLLLHLINQNYKVYALSFNYGQKHRIEIDLAKKNIFYFKNNGFDNQIIHKIFDISNVFENFSSSLLNKEEKVPEGHYEDCSMKSTFVPNRNACNRSMD